MGADQQQGHPASRPLPPNCSMARGARLRSVQMAAAALSVLMHTAKLAATSEPVTERIIDGPSDR